ncbi:MAG TPA: CRTAC1 family protein [Gemmataceae bacterium]|nr:CRTAC1 family protein [Gemmataceae bacterium]
MNSFARLLLFGLLLVASGTGCAGSQGPVSESGEESTGPDWFEDATNQVGLDFVHDAGPVDGKYFMPQIVGSGAALFDANGDGTLDCYLLHNGGLHGARNRLFLQGEDGCFHDASAGSGLDVAGHSMGVAVGDVNNDGKADVLVTQYGCVKLFFNRGGGKFIDVTEKSGLINPAWGTSAAFFDYDRDGWLDLVVVNYVDYDRTHPCTAPNGEADYCVPKVFAGRVSCLFHNLGGKSLSSRFQDVTLESGLGRLTGPGLGVVCADFDGDGWPDIFVANDGQPNRLWINQHNGTFQEEAVRRGVAYNGMGHAWAGMGIAHADFDGDGLHDLFVTHLRGETNNLWVQGPRGLFHDKTGLSGLASSRWLATGFGVVAADFDQDGWPDLAVVNGGVSRHSAPAEAQHLGTHWSGYAERNQLFVNLGSGRFRDASSSSPTLCAIRNVGRALAAGDVNGDGAIDLLLTTVAGRARLLRNVAPNRGHWLYVRCREPALHRDAVGALVRIKAGGRWRAATADPGGSYLCSSDGRAHFGLGTVDRVEVLTVRWPDGSWESFPGPPVDREATLHKGDGSPVEGDGK